MLPTQISWQNCGLDMDMGGLSVSFFYYHYYFLKFHLDQLVQQSNVFPVMFTSSSSLNLDI